LEIGFCHRRKDKGRSINLNPLMVIK